MAELTHPEWWPPQQGDRIVDRDNDVWVCRVPGFFSGPNDSQQHAPSVLRHYAPLTLVERFGRFYVDQAVSPAADAPAEPAPFGGYQYVDIDGDLLAVSCSTLSGRVRLLAADKADGEKAGVWLPPADTPALCVAILTAAGLPLPLELDPAWQRHEGDAPRGEYRVVASGGGGSWDATYYVPAGTPGPPARPFPTTLGAIVEDDESSACEHDLWRLTDHGEVGRGVRALLWVRLRDRAYRKADELAAELGDAWTEWAPVTRDSTGPAAS